MVKGNRSRLPEQNELGGFDNPITVKKENRMSQNMVGLYLEDNVMLSMNSEFIYQKIVDPLSPAVGRLFDRMASKHTIQGITVRKVVR